MTATALRRLPLLLLAVAGALLAPFLLPATAHADQPFGGNVGYSWDIPGAPSSGLRDLTVPMTIHEGSAREDGTYVSAQFAFTGISSGGYMGLQPRADENGHARLHGVFSSFIPGTTSTDSQCTDGADGGAGVSCANDVDAVAGRTYDLRIERTGANTWTGTMIDTLTGAEQHIGTFTLPAGSGNLTGSSTGFVENYWNYSGTCEGIQRIDTTIGRPTTSSGLVGSASAPHEYGECTGQANYAASAQNGTLRISRGWS